MYSLKCSVLLFACLILAATASPIQYGTILEPGHLLDRHIRSPDHGSIGAEVTKNQDGRKVSVDYNHNIYTSKDGRGTIDAYAQASRNFDRNHNDFNGGIRGSWKF